jgi:hypothetical protein
VTWPASILNSLTLFLFILARIVQSEVYLCKPVLHSPGRDTFSPPSIAGSDKHVDGNKFADHDALVQGDRYLVEGWTRREKKKIQ